MPIVSSISTFPPIIGPRFFPAMCDRRALDFLLSAQLFCPVPCVLLSPNRRVLSHGGGQHSTISEGRDKADTQFQSDSAKGKDPRERQFRT